MSCSPDVMNLVFWGTSPFKKQEEPNSQGSDFRIILPFSLSHIENSLAPNSSTALGHLIMVLSFGASSPLHDEWELSEGDTGPGSHSQSNEVTETCGNSRSVSLYCFNKIYQ